MADSALPSEIKSWRPTPGVCVAWGVLLGAFAFFYWPSLHRLVEIWLKEEDYQHGFFVPLFSLFLLWHRRDMVAREPFHGSLWGLPLLLLWAAMRWVAIYFNFGTLTELSIIPFFAGTAVFVGGWPALHWSWPSIAFLIFMLPLPGVVQDFSRDNLQILATRLSVYVIQTLGVRAVPQGVVIELSDRSLQVAEACSGLRMMMLFLAICVGAAFVVRKPLWERLLMVASAPPIAVISNVARIVLTALVGELARLWPALINPETADKFMHDMAGLLMMPIGLAILLAEMTLLARLFPADESEGPAAARKLLSGVELQAGGGRELRHTNQSD